MYRHKGALNERTRKLLSFALILSNFDYAVSAWFPGLTKGLKRKLQVSQNKVVRFILGRDHRPQIGHAEFKRVGFVNVEHRAKQLMLNQMFKSAPTYITEGFSKVRSSHTHSTRSAECNFVVPIIYDLARHNCGCHGAKHWNSLPLVIKQSPSIHNFKAKVKTYLFHSLEDNKNSEFIY